MNNPLEGWHRWSETAPPPGVLIQIEDFNGDVFLGMASEHKVGNAGDLLWRLTGIGKHQLACRAEAQHRREDQCKNTK